MNNDFKKYATRHLGINSMVLDDVISTQNQYLNPYILEERQLNVTQMDVFSRLMMDRIIFLGLFSWGHKSMIIQLILSRLNSCTLTAQIQERISVSTSTVLGEVCMLDLAFMIRCSSSVVTWQLSAQVWQPAWPLFFWCLVLKANAAL